MVKTRGIVELEEVVAGVVRRRRVVENAISYAFRTQEALWMAGETTFVLPGYVALGVGTAAASLNQRSITEMVSEVIRNPLASNPAVLTTGTRFRSIFVGNDIAVDISELMLFAQDATVVVIHNADGLANWTTGTNQTLSVDTSLRREGTGSLSVVTSAGGPSNVTFRNEVLSSDITGATHLQIWFYVDDASSLSGNLEIELSSSTSDDTDEWQWNTDTAGLVDGWQFLNLAISDASVSGSPDLANIVRFRLSVAKSHPVTVKIDNIRAFAANGTSLARVELSPIFDKQIGSVLNITWTILPSFESKINTFLWEGGDTALPTQESAVIADTTTELVENGSGTFPTVASHPWTYTKMWAPAASGYMAGGNKAGDTVAGSLTAWVRFIASEPSNNAIVWDWREDSNNRITLFWNAGSNLWTVEYVQSATTSSTTVGDTPSGDDYAFVVVTWDSSGLGISLNGAAKTNVSITTLITAISEEPTIGGGSGLVTTNLKIGPVQMFSRVLSDAEISSLNSLARKYVYGED